MNGLKHSIKLAVNLVVPGPQNLIARTSQCLVTNTVAAATRIGRVLPTVDFHDQSGAAALEVHDV
jgi:hypothetical protein